MDNKNNDFENKIVLLTTEIERLKAQLSQKN